MGAEWGHDHHHYYIWTFFQPYMGQKNPNMGVQWGVVGSVKPNIYIIIYLLYQNDFYSILVLLSLLSCCCFLSEVLDGSSYGFVIKCSFNLVIYFFFTIYNNIFDIIITFQISSPGWQECSSKLISLFIFILILFVIVAVYVCMCI